MYELSTLSRNMDGANAYTGCFYCGFNVCGVLPQSVFPSNAANCQKILDIGILKRTMGLTWHKCSEWIVVRSIGGNHIGHSKYRQRPISTTSEGLLEGKNLERLRTFITARYFLSARPKWPSLFWASPSSVRYSKDCISSRSNAGLGASF